MLLGLNADRNTSDPLAPSILSASLPSLNAGKRVSEVKREGAGQLLPLLDSPLFLAGLASHGKPTLTCREGRRELLNMQKYGSLRLNPIE